MKTEKMLPVRVKNIARARITEPVGDRQHAEAQLRLADRLVLLGRDLVRVPAPPAALARPLLAVAEVALLAALAGDRDRRAAEDRAGGLVPDPLALGALLAVPGATSGMTRDAIGDVA